ncbi:glycosyltransferase [Acetobacter estunensis]|uniref:Glycosyltransferase n=2 Tax=Acetobacter estunensis TaxID=104097 RepID=A0A967B5J1_9PROT|nr:glycosyltransferase [Acetobacter estunensis]NHO52531.1 glycosyltransferase [Acetobacter estunensis]
MSDMSDLPVSIFSLLSSPELDVFFAPPALRDVPPDTAAHMPLLLGILISTRPHSLALVGVPPAIADYVRSFLILQAFDTRTQSLNASEAPARTGSPLDIAVLDLTRLKRAAETLTTLRPSLAPDALLFLNGTETDTGAAVWNALAATHPHCLFPDTGGAGIVALGAIPCGLNPLFEARTSSTQLARLRIRLSRLGSAWAGAVRQSTFDAESLHQKDSLDATRHDLLQTRLALLETRERLSQAAASAAEIDQQPSEPPEESQAVAPTTVDPTWMQQARTLIEEQNSRLATLQTEIQALQSAIQARSGLFRGLLRTLRHPNFSPHIPTVPAPLELPALPEIESAVAGTHNPASPLPVSALRRNVLFVSGEPATPGTLYRCTRNAAACALVGHFTRVLACADVGPADVEWADVIVLWRVEYSPHVAILIRLSKEKGTTVIFDTDDLVFIPALASIAIIDGIRTVDCATESIVHITFQNMRATMERADACFATTDFMATEMRRIARQSFTLPNIYDAACLRRSRMAARILASVPGDGLIRIGYASGTRTHQRDFALVAEVLARLMQKHSEVRLVLFHETGNKRPVLLMDEFPALLPVADQIEWRDMVPLERLPEEFARFDISIAPLELDNVFCEAKSEIKYLEAALAGVPSVVSPTAPYRDCVTDGVTGFLAETPTQWEDALTRLVTDPSLRRSLARNALNQVLWTFGPQRQALLFESIIMSFCNDAATARASETLIARGRYQGRGVPEVPEYETLFAHDALEAADVSVIITSHNYHDVILDALESVRSQSVQKLDLIIVDDASTDDSVALITHWAQQNAARFNRLLVLAPLANVGLGGARNIGVSASETPYFLSLDADNRLRADACEKLLAACDPLTAYAYPTLRQFGAAHDLMGNIPSRPLQLRNGNYIDAMALVAKWAWSAAGGYYVKRDAMGWEDYDLWCTLAELGLKGVHVSEPVAEYRVHGESMTNSVTETHTHKANVVTYIKARHPWLDMHHEARSRG